MPHNRGTRRKPNYVGVAAHKGRRKWVSGCASVAEYNEAIAGARPNWYVYWNAVRASAGLPELEFYELKHRALQWMIDPVDDGSLGLDHATAAEMAGHADGGWLIANVYTKLSQRKAIERARRAMSEYATRHPEENHRPTARRSPSSPDATAKNQRRVAVTDATLITRVHQDREQDS